MRAFTSLFFDCNYDGACARFVCLLCHFPPFVFHRSSVLFCVFVYLLCARASVSFLFSFLCFLRVLTCARVFSNCVSIFCHVSWIHFICFVIVHLVSVSSIFLSASSIFWECLQFFCAFPIFSFFVCSISLCPFTLSFLFLYFLGCVCSVLYCFLCGNS